MTSIYDPNLRITEQGTNDNPNTWGLILNQQVIALLCAAVAGVTQIDFSTGSQDISTSSLIPPNNLPGVGTGTADTARNAVLELTSTIVPLTGPLTLTLPAVQKVYFIRAAQTGSFPINIMCKGGSQSLSFSAGQASIIYTNGTNIYQANSTSALKASNNLSDLISAATARTNLGLGNASLLTAGTAANNLVQLDGSAKLPAIDGSQLINVVGTPAGIGTAAYLSVGTAAGNIPQLNGSAQLPAVSGALLTNLPTPAGVPVVTLSSNWKVVMGAFTIQGGPCTTSPGGLTTAFGTPFSGTPLMVWGQGGNANSSWPCTSWTPTTALGVLGNGSGGAEAGFYMAVGPT